MTVPSVTLQTMVSDIAKDYHSGTTSLDGNKLTAAFIQAKNEGATHIAAVLANEEASFHDGTEISDAFDGAMHNAIQQDGGDPGSFGFGDAAAATTMKQTTGGNLSDITNQLSLLKAKIDDSTEKDGVNIKPMADHEEKQIESILNSGKGQDGKDLTEQQKSGLQQTKLLLQDLGNSVDDKSYDPSNNSKILADDIGSLISAAPKAAPAA